MTERGLPIVGGAPACPFVAFDDDRDERATSPDHRHRCYAENPPAPRALAHQEAYCLASAFPVCPTFQDWARREAARARPGDVPPEDATDEPGLPPLVADRPPSRGSRTAWSAPPPWLGASGSATPPPGTPPPPAGASSPAPGAGSRGEAPDDEGSAAGLAAAAAAGGLTGSFADRMASRGGGEPADWASGGAAAAASRDEAGRPDDGPGYADDAADEDDAVAAARPVRHRERLESGSDRMESDREREDGGPSWERPRRLEAYPTLRSHRWSATVLPTVLLALVALLLAAAALFFVPQLLGLLGPGPAGSANPSAAPSGAPAGSSGPSFAPAATPLLYTVQPNDTMTKIAKKFGVSLADLIAANKDKFPNPDQIKIGDVLVIPAATPSGLSGAPPAASP